MQADARSALRGLLNALQARGARAQEREWLARLGDVRDAHRRTLSRLSEDSAEPMHPAALAAELAAALPADALIAYDGGHTTFWSNDFTPFSAPRTRFNEVGATQLGFGLPFALAAKLANPAAPVFNITGDGAFGFTIQELDTARRYALPVVNVIHNNASWGVIKTAHQRGYGFTLGDDLEGTDYAAIARGFGCFGEVVTARGRVRGAVNRALASGLPAVIDCRVRFEPHPCLPDFGRMGSVGLSR
jgi:acetolactate synthase-1/2/3 large subunit